MLLQSLDTFHKKLELLRLRLEQVLNFINALQTSLAVYYNLTLWAKAEIKY